MTECCGESRDSRFCPECGAQLISDPLVDLLKHCRSTESGCRKRADRARHRMEIGLDRLQANFIEGQARAAGKWKLWGDALAARLGVEPASHEEEEPG